MTLGCFLPFLYPSAADAEEVFADCDTPSARDSCNRWYTTASVSLTWRPDPGGGMLQEGCQTGFFTAEARIERTCKWFWPVTNKTAITTVWIGIDRTPPRVLAPHPSRTPDYNGWFNHPVDLAFAGSDATSGVASCSSLIYAGPEGAGVPVRGTCRDVAGNVGARSFPINYDATPPSAPFVDAKPGNRRVALGWFPPPDAEASEVVRFAPGSPPVSVFFGQAGGYTDRGLRNETRYRYSVSVIDRAGNRAQSQVSAVPSASKLLSRPPGARLRPPPLLTWQPVRRATYYQVQLHRERKVLSAWPRKSQLQLRRKWRFRGKRFRLAPGRYRWYVWPGFGRRAAHRYGRSLGSSTFRVIR